MSLMKIFLRTFKKTMANKQKPAFTVHSTPKKPTLLEQLKNSSRPEEGSPFVDIMQKKAGKRKLDEPEPETSKKLQKIDAPPPSPSPEDEWVKDFVPYEQSIEGHAGHITYFVQNPQNTLTEKEVEILLRADYPLFEKDKLVSVGISRSGPHEGKRCLFINQKFMTHIVKGEVQPYAEWKLTGAPKPKIESEKVENLVKALADEQKETRKILNEILKVQQEMLNLSKVNK